VVWLGRILLVAYAGWLAWRAAPPSTEAVALPGLSLLTEPRTALGLLQQLAAWALSDSGRFLPLGLFAALSWPPRERYFDRLLRVWLPAHVVTLALVLGIRSLEAGAPGRVPPMLPLLTAAVMGMLGVWLGVTLTLTRGLAGCLLAPLKLAVLALVLAAGLGALAWAAIQDEPLGFQPARATSEEKRRLYKLFRDKSPTRLEGAETAELRLAAHDLDVLLAWGLAAHPGAKARVALDASRARLEASAALPRSGYLNLVAEAEPSVTAGKAQLAVERLEVGGHELPLWLARPLAGLALRALDARDGGILQAIRGLAVRDGALVLTYGPARLPRGFVADLFHGEGAGGRDQEGVNAQLARLAARAGKAPSGGDARHAAAVEAAFGLARERSGSDGALRENRAAILALGLTLGSRRLAPLVGGVAAAELRAASSGWRGATLRGRGDWVRHFWISAALTVLSLSEASDAAGLLKEELDADGGSGFSFADLLADRSGTVFAERATGDEAAAHAVQQQLANGFATDAVFPSAEGLPEGLQDAELRARYGGVGGEGYRRLLAEIERRIAGLSALSGR
jgi:hypothetical protein